jgi:hypothetical protein
MLTWILRHSYDTKKFLLRKKDKIVMSKNSDFKIKSFGQKNQIPHENRHHAKKGSNIKWSRTLLSLKYVQKDTETKKIGRSRFY